MKSMALRLHFGLRGRLFTAFGAVAALTVLASAVAMISYGSLGESLGAITTKSLPEITRASDVVKAADEVAAAAPRFLAAADPAERENAARAIATGRENLAKSIGTLARRMPRVSARPRTECLAISTS